jgi:hypothetical protein
MKLDDKAAAARTGLSTKTLANWRWAGTGPPYYKLGGRVLYDRDDLDVWLAARRRTSTSDPGPKQPAAAA